MTLKEYGIDLEKKQEVKKKKKEKIVITLEVEKMEKA